jgi:hypothetical protein
MVVVVVVVAAAVIVVVVGTLHTSKLVLFSMINVGLQKLTNLMGKQTIKSIGCLGRGADVVLDRKLA